MPNPIEICKWGFKPKTYRFEGVGHPDKGSFTCHFGGATIALPSPMQAVLFHDLLLQAGYTPEPESVTFITKTEKATQ